MGCWKEQGCSVADETGLQLAGLRRFARLGRTGDLIVIVRGRRQLGVLSISTCIGSLIAQAHVVTQVGSLSRLRRFGLGCIALALVCLWLQVTGVG